MQPGCHKGRDEIFQLDALSGGADFDLAKQIVGQFNGRSHESIFAYLCERVKTMGFSGYTAELLPIIRK